MNPGIKERYVVLWLDEHRIGWVGVCLAYVNLWLPALVMWGGNPGKAGRGLGIFSPISHSASRLGGTVQYIRTVPTVG
jgi:hypothetical protein